MNILLTFIPWILFWSFLSAKFLVTSIVAGFIATVIVILIDVFRGKKTKILQLGTLFFFAGILAILFISQSFWIMKWISIIGKVVLALIVLISILIKSPFTLQYSKETAPKERWEEPMFIHANYVISWAWFFAFIVMLVVPLYLEKIGINVTILLNWLISIVCFVVAIGFTHWYKHYVKKKY